MAVRFAHARFLLRSTSAEIETSTDQAQETEGIMMN